LFHAQNRETVDLVVYGCQLMGSATYKDHRNLHQGITFRNLRKVHHLRPSIFSITDK